jgi:hypothetical protein
VSAARGRGGDGARAARAGCPLRRPGGFAFPRVRSRPAPASDLGQPPPPALPSSAHTPGGTTHGTVWEQYARMRDALNATGKPIYFSITQALPWTEGPPTEFCYGPSAFTTLAWVPAQDPTTLANR